MWFGVPSPDFSRPARCWKHSAKGQVWGSSFPPLKTLRRGEENTEALTGPWKGLRDIFPLPPRTGHGGLQAAMLLESLYGSEDKPACVLPVKHNWSDSLVRRAHAGCFSSLLERHLTIGAIEFYFSVSVSQPGPSVAPCAAFRANEVVRTVNSGMHPGGFTSEEGLGLIPSAIRETQWFL